MTTTCNRPGCAFTTTAQCADGHSPASECPQLTSGDADAASAVSDELTDQVTLPEGDALTCADAEAITRASRTEVVVLAGAAESGKTTLLTSLYESFQDAPFGGFLFAGSATLPGFERRCHEGRVAAGTFEPDTARTNSKDGLRFLHLAIRQQNRLNQRKHLLVSDISGELFRNVANSTDEARRLPILRRADRLVLMLDGARLADPAVRHAAFNDARSILRSIVEADVLHPSCNVDVVFSKWDVVSSTLPESTLPFVTEIEKSLTATFSPKVKALRFFPVAARPTSQLLPFAHGIAQLLTAWMIPDANVSRPTLFAVPVDEGPEYARFAQRLYRRAHLEQSYELERI